MNENLLFLDTETTGTDTKYDSIIQLSGFLRINGEEKEEFNWHIKPYNSNPMDPKATAVHGVTKEQADNFPLVEEAYKSFCEMLDRNGIGPDNKVFIVGYNSQFDATLLKGMFEKCGDFYLWKKYVNTPDIDMMRWAIIFLHKYRYSMKNFQLSTVYNFMFNEDFNAHDAMADIRATERIFDFLNENFINNLFMSKVVEDPEKQLSFDFSPDIPVRKIN